MKQTAELTEQEIVWWRENEFRIVNQRTYLDNAAISPLPKRVEQSIAMFHCERSESGAMFPLWWERAEQVRGQTAALIGAAAEEIAFLANVSMGINIIAQGLEWQPGDNVIISDLEFPANVYPWLNLESRGVEVRFLANRNGSLMVSDLECLIDSRTKVVSLSYVEAGNGFKNNLKTVSDICRKNNILFVVDAIQGLGVHELDVKSVPCDFLVGGYYKWLLGPEGLAFLYVRKELLPQLNTAFAGWAGMADKFQYSEYRFEKHDSARRYELGNLNYSAIQGAGVALQMISEIGIHRIRRRVLHLAEYICNRLVQIDGIRILSDFPSENRTQILLVRCPNAWQVHQNLLAQKVAVSFREGLRISPHFYNTEQEIDHLAYILESEVH
jgi:cysteine desulfurase/selenocysteine lyase